MTKSITKVLEELSWTKIPKDGKHELDGQSSIHYEYLKNDLIEFTITIDESTGEIYKVKYDFNTNELSIFDVVNIHHPVKNAMVLDGQSDEMYNIMAFLETADVKKSITYTYDSWLNLTVLPNGDWYTSYDIETHERVSYSKLIDTYTYSTVPETKVGSHNVVSSDTKPNNIDMTFDELEAFLFQKQTSEPLSSTLETVNTILAEMK